MKSIGFTWTIEVTQGHFEINEHRYSVKFMLLTQFQNQGIVCMINQRQRPLFSPCSHGSRLIEKLHGFGLLAEQNETKRVACCLSAALLIILGILYVPLFDCCFNLQLNIISVGLKLICNRCSKSAKNIPWKRSPFILTPQKLSLDRR